MAQLKLADLRQIAEEFNTSADYSSGDYCVYQGLFYQFTKAHSGAWNAADVVQTDVGEELTDLKQDLTKVVTINDGSWEVGSYNFPDGANYASNSRIRLTKYVGYSLGYLNITALTGYEFSVFAWNASTKEYVGAWMSSNTFAKNGTLKWISTFDLSNYDGYIVKVALRNASSPTSTMTTDLCINCAFTLSKIYELHEDVDGVREDVDGVRSDLNGALFDKCEWKEPTNWFVWSTITMGELLADGTTTESTTRYYTDFIPVTGWTRARVFRGDTLGMIYMRHVACYDSNKEIISGGSDSSSSTFLIPANVSYIRITFDYLSNISPSTMVTNDIVPTVYSTYFDPKWIVSEDFLTADSESAVDKIKNNELSTANLTNNFACSAPIAPLRQTVGIPETFYLKTARTPDETTFLDLSAGLEYSQRKTDRTYFANDTVYSSVNGYAWYMFDALFNRIKLYNGNGAGGARNFIAENLVNCSLLAIGDSTVDQDVMTRKLLDYFTMKGKTITLLGTLGADGNYNEGRAGWKATDYLTNRTYDGVVNPFYNPSSATFDFNYYMSNQGYSAPNFVVIQLGINDLGNNNQTYDNIWAAIKTMIDSIRTYNASIKIILNLPTTPTANQDSISAWLPMYKNRVVSYDQFAQEHALVEYGENAVRCSYCHLILDPETEIMDNVHPTNAGYEKMAMELVNQINCWQNGA